ncbi:MAG: hypothetical protein KF713_15305 [Turneriella sp.]|nr:hypothetical protein [Turneriella sp.]
MNGKNEAHGEEDDKVTTRQRKIILKFAIPCLPNVKAGRVMRLRAICFGLALAIAGGYPLAAKEETSLVAGVHTDLPLSLGSRLGIEFPGRWRAATSLGFLPEGYIRTLNTLLVNNGAYNQSTADLIQSTLKSSLVWRLHVGYRPFANYGFHIEAGYGLVTLGGSATASEIISGVSGTALPANDAGKSFNVSSTLYMLNLELGWEWFWHDLYFRVSLGGSFTAAASTSVKANYTPTFPRLTETFATSTQNYLNSIYTSYVHTPTVSLTVGYRFF